MSDIQEVWSDVRHQTYKRLGLTSDIQEVRSDVLILGEENR